MKHRINDNGNALNVHQHFFLANSPHPDTVIDLTAGQKWRLMGKRKYQTLFCFVAGSGSRKNVTSVITCSKRVMPLSSLSEDW